MIMFLLIFIIFILFIVWTMFRIASINDQYEKEKFDFFNK